MEEFKFVRERSCAIVDYSKVEDAMLFKWKTARERFDSCGFSEVPTSETRECSEPSFSCRGGDGALGLGIIIHQTYEQKINAHNECAQVHTGDGQAA